MRFFVLIILALCSLSLFSQSKGDQLRDEGNLTQAIEAYKSDFIQNPKDARNTYNLACAFALTFAQKDSAFHYLDIALKNDNSLWALADNDLISLTDDPRWKTIQKEQLKKYQTTKGKLEEPEYATQLLMLIMKDQALDYQIDLAKKYYMKNGQIPHWYYPIAHLKKQFSSGNFDQMEQLIATHGWPSYSKVGKLAADGPLLIINHHEKDEIRIKYLPQIKAACLSKEGSCMEYAKIQDRILVNQGKPQIYGMQFRYDANRKLVPFPVEEPAYVDQKRLAIGLEPIKDYLKRKINFNWEIVQKRK